MWPLRQQSQKVNPGYQAVAWPPEVRPGAFVPNHGVCWNGDSTFVGVGDQTSPVEYSPPGLFISMMPGATVVRNNTGGAKTDAIRTAYQALSSTIKSTYYNVATGGLNNYGVATKAANWIGQINTDYLTGMFDTDMSGQDYQYWGPVCEEGTLAGMQNYADYRALYRIYKAARADHLIDTTRYFLARGNPDPTRMDRINRDTWGGLPWSFRGTGGSPGSVPYATGANPRTIIPVRWGDVTQAGMGKACGLGADDGTLFQNVDPTNGLNQDCIFRKCGPGGSGSITVSERKHLNRTTNLIWATGVKDRLAALEGRGAPFLVPGEGIIALDAASTTVAATLYFTYGGAGTPVATILDSNLASLFTATVSGNTVVITRSAAGSLVEGHYLLPIQMSDGTGMQLNSEHDIYVGRPSTQTTPKLLTIASNVDMAWCGRNGHNLADGTKFWCVFWGKPGDLSNNPYIFNFAALSGSGSLTLQFQSDGSVKVVGRNDAFGVVFNASGNAGMVTTTSECWIALEMDCSGTNPAVKG